MFKHRPHWLYLHLIGMTHFICVVVISLQVFLRLWFLMVVLSLFKCSVFNPCFMYFLWKSQVRVYSINLWSQVPCNQCQIVFWGSRLSQIFLFIKRETKEFLKSFLVLTDRQIFLLTKILCYLSLNLFKKWLLALKLLHCRRYTFTLLECCLIISYVTISL